MKRPQQEATACQNLQDFSPTFSTQWSLFHTGSLKCCHLSASLYYVQIEILSYFFSTRWDCSTKNMSVASLYSNSCVNTGSVLPGDFVLFHFSTNAAFRCNFLWKKCCLNFWPGLVSSHVSYIYIQEIITWWSTLETLYGCIRMRFCTAPPPGHLPRPDREALRNFCQVDLCIISINLGTWDARRVLLQQVADRSPVPGLTSHGRPWFEKICTRMLAESHNSNAFKQIWPWGSFLDGLTWLSSYHWLWRSWHTYRCKK